MKTVGNKMFDTKFIFDSLRMCSYVRRLPEWQQAFARALNNHPELLIELDGKKALRMDPEGHRLVDYADQEFIEWIIKNT
jgi:hypothetical protein